MNDQAKILRTIIEELARSYALQDQPLEGQCLSKMVSDFMEDTSYRALCVQIVRVLNANGYEIALKRLPPPPAS